MEYLQIAAIIMLGAAVLSMTMMAQQAFALKNLFNCISNVSKDGKLSFDDYVKCFNEQFHGQLNGPAHSGDSVKP